MIQTPLSQELQQCVLLFLIPVKLTFEFFDSRSFDTDNDGLSDGIETVEWFDPLDANPDGDTYNDYEEYINKTDPFIYNLTAEEWGQQFIEGAIKGDLIENPTVPQLVGQITLGVIPIAGVFCDVRDALVNAIYEHWLFAAISLSGVIYVVGDLTSGSSKILKFINKHLDDTDEIADLLLTLSKKFPDDFAKLVPNSSLDDIIEAFKKTNYISRSSYDEIAEIFEKAGKKFPTIADDFPSAERIESVEDVWRMGWSERGFRIDKLLGNNLGPTYKTYDFYDEATQIAISNKSIDIMCKTYQDPNKFEKLLNKYGKQLLNGENTVIKDNFPYAVERKCLKLAFPDIPLTTAQKSVLTEFINNNTEYFDIIIKIIT